jgi:diguanylate cyclase (GGDEF)-like protein
MTESTVPLIVMSARQDDVETVNRILREAGHAVHCHWVQQLDTLAETIEAKDPQLLWLFADSAQLSVRDIVKTKQQLAHLVPLIVVRSVADENAITEAMQSGAQDLVSVGQRDRLRAVAERELRSFRLERALNETLKSASQYKQQLKAFMAGSADSIAYVQEGILVETNKAWAELFGHESTDDAIGPVMDCVDSSSQAALKGALSACLKGHWDGKPLKVTGLRADGPSMALTVLLEPTRFDGDDAVKLSMPRESKPAEAPEKLLQQAVHKDPMTGFFHRRRFVELLTDRLETTPRSGVRALAYIRPDKFGDIEDEVGPLASEDILVQVAEILRGLAHENDLCGRFGGTIFTLLLERGTLRDIEAWAEHVLSRISDHIFEVAHNTLSLACTIGLAEIGPTTDRVETLITDAEHANQRGRQRGGNQVVLEETSDESTRILRLDAIWVQRIKAALVEDRLRLAHLRIASLNGGSEVIFDTILRLADEQGDETPAAEFMSVAARNSLLRPIDRWVIGASIRFCATNTCELVFVKLSADSIRDKTLMEWIVQQTQTHKVDPARICFQITEEDATQYMKQTSQVAEQIRQAGYQFAIEHFGIGRDPMKVLAQTPMNYLKIDGSLMQSLATDITLQEKVRGFIKAAEKRKIKTVAERIEDANTMAVLYQLGASYMQGHYLHEPDVVLEEPPETG